MIGRVTDNKTNVIYGCGGSLITMVMVLTAAHCFWDADENTVSKKP